MAHSFKRQFCHGRADSAPLGPNQVNQNRWQWGCPPQPTPLFNRHTILQTLFGSGSTASGKEDSKNLNRIRSQVLNKLQTANDQAARAQSACDRASYGSDKYARKQAAEEAYYAAQAANSAADAAYSLSGGTTSDISGLASQARSAADRAQGAADRASANANGGGW